MKRYHLFTTGELGGYRGSFESLEEARDLYESLVRASDSLRFDGLDQAVVWYTQDDGSLRVYLYGDPAFAEDDEECERIFDWRLAR